MRAYKFLNSAHLDGVMTRGLFRIGTASSFRVDDGVDDGRNDPLEGASRLQPGPSTYSLRDHPILAKAIGFTPENTPDSSIVFEGDAAFHFIVDVYLFCASAKLTRLCVHKMKDLFDCDTAVVISDFNRFGEIINASHPPPFENSDFPDLPPRSCAISAVTYRDHKPTKIVPVDPFTKRAKFRWQNEMRLVWGGTNPREPFFIEVPEVIPLLRPVDLSKWA